MNFLQNGPLLNELTILNCIKKDSRMSQGEISKRVNLAPSMVNNYIKKLEQQGYLKKTGSSNRQMEYILTEDGHKRRLYLLISYASEVINLNKMAKLEMEKRLADVIKSGIKTIMFYGAGETGEVAVQSIKNLDVSLIGFIDDNMSLIGSDFYGYKVYASEDINKIKPDAVVITSFTYQEQISSKLKDILDEKEVKILAI